MKTRVRDPVTGKNVVVSDMTYSEWLEWKKSQDPEAVEVAFKKAKNSSADAKQWKEYQKILGKDAPATLDAFQNLKYTNTGGWAETKRFFAYKKKYPTSNKQYFNVQEELKRLGIQKGDAIPPILRQAFILPSGSRDPYHIMHRMAERNITDDELRGYVKNAKVMFSQWGGKREMFLGNEGMCVIEESGDSWVYKTAWKNSDFDEAIDSILEVIRNAGL